MIDDVETLEQTAPEYGSRRPPRRAARDAETTSLGELFQSVRNSGRLIATTAIALAVVGVALAFLTRRDYTATSQFMANEQQQQGMSRVAGLAAQFGLDLSSLSGGESQEFYAKLVRSREVLEQVILTDYRFATQPGGRDSISGNLLTLYELTDLGPRRAMQEAIVTLDDEIAVTADAGSGILLVRTSARWPELAEAINRRLLQLVNEFNLNRRQSRASAERRFVEERLKESRAELERAERTLSDFYARNRSYRSSPTLSLEESKLERRVDLGQQLYSSLVQSYEQARIDEVRNTPVITVIDDPTGTALRRRGLVISALLGLVLGASIGVGIAFYRTYAASYRRVPAY